MKNDDQQQEFDMDLVEQHKTRQPVNRTETFGERIDRNIKGKAAIPVDPEAHSEEEFSEGDDLADWHLRHEHPENP